MKVLRTEIEIKATPEKVWSILTNLACYPEWNPFIHHAIGTAKLGGKVDITFKQGAKDMTLHCTVVRVKKERELAWQYHVIFPFLWQGEHSFTIQPLGAKLVKFIDVEIFRGLLIPLQAKDIDTNSRRDFKAMDKALKARAESAKK